ncbi:MAG TPA: alpha/beta-hydrolase family protein, partial [Euzebyales bacterium]
HATDPVVWFSPSLAWSQPQWLREPPGPGVPSHMVWRPVLTFEQVLMDLPLASSTAPGYGHDYDADVPLAWLEIVRPQGWQQAQTEQMLYVLDP